MFSTPKRRALPERLIIVTDPAGRDVCIVDFSPSYWPKDIPYPPSPKGQKKKIHLDWEFLDDEDMLKIKVYYRDMLSIAEIEKQEGEDANDRRKAKEMLRHIQRT